MRVFGAGTRALSLASEQLEEQTANGLSVDVALLANVTGQINRCAERINELMPVPPAKVEDTRTHPYWHEPFHAMSPERWEAYCRDWPDDPDPAFADEKRARAALATAMPLTPEQKILSDRMHEHMHRMQTDDAYRASCTEEALREKQRPTPTSDVVSDPFADIVRELLP